MQASNYVYTLVAYRPNGVDTCRNCVMGRSDSDFSLTVFLSAQDVASHWARSIDSESEGSEYCGTEYTLLLNGYRPSDDPFDDSLLDAEGYSPYERERQLVDCLVKQNLARTQQEQQEAARAAERIAQAQREAAEQEAAAAREQQELLEYQRLKAKFEAAGH